MRDEETKYWDAEWHKRINDESVNGNRKKYVRIMKFLLDRPYLFNKNKLDVGCGPAHHAIALSGLIKNFAETWTGIDLSEKAVAFACAHGLNAHVTDFHKFDTADKYQVFFFWDSLEHFEDTDSVALKVAELADNSFTVCGNVPLFHSTIEGGIEKPMNISIVKQFLQSCGCTGYDYKVYDTSGWPFLIFEGVKE